MCPVRALAILLKCFLKLKEFCRICLRSNDQKLIATYTVYLVLLAHDLLECGSNIFEKIITRKVSLCIVDGLKPVYIDEEYTERL